MYRVISRHVVSRILCSWCLLIETNSGFERMWSTTVTVIGTFSILFNALVCINILSYPVIILHPFGLGFWLIAHYFQVMTCVITSVWTLFWSDHSLFRIWSKRFLWHKVLCNDNLRRNLWFSQLVVKLLFNNLSCSLFLSCNCRVICYESLVFEV